MDEARTEMQNNPNESDVGPDLLHTYAVRAAEAAGLAAEDILKRRSLEPNGSCFVQEWPISYTFTSERDTEKLRVRVTVEDISTYQQQLSLPNTE